MKMYTVVTDVDTFFVTENARKALEKAKEAPSPVWVVEDHVNTFPHKEVIYQDISSFREKYKLY